MIGPWPLGRLIARIQDALTPWIDRKIDVAIPLAFGYYLDADADPFIAGYNVAATTPPTGADTPFVQACATADTLIATWITSAGQPNTREIPEGIVQIQISAAKTAGTKGAFIYAELYSRTPGGVETLLGTSGDSGRLVAGTTAVPLHMLVALTTIDPADRLVLKIYGSPSGSGTAPTVTLHVEGATLARFEVQVRPVSVTPSLHATAHEPGGGDAMTVDAAAATGSLRTLGTGAQQACGGTDARLSDARAPVGTATGAVRAKVVALVEDAGGPPCNIETSAGVFDASLGNVFRLTATKDGVVRFPTTGLVDAQEIRFEITQPAAAKNVSFAAGYVAAGTGAAVPNADLTNSKTSIYTGFYVQSAAKIVLYYTPPSGF